MAAPEPALTQVASYNSQLLNLPGELRMIIWDHVFEHSSVVVTYMPSNLSKPPNFKLHKEFRSRRKGCHLHPLLHVCRKSHEDVRRSFYEKIHFKVDPRIYQRYNHLPVGLTQ